MYKIKAPSIIPIVPAIIVRNTDSNIICFLIWFGLAPIALLIPISFVRSFTDINKIFPIPITPASIVAIPIIIEIKDMPLAKFFALLKNCLLYTSPSPRDLSTSRMPSSA